MIIVYVVICAVGLFMYIQYAELSGIYMKADKYDYFEPYMKQIEQCTSIPMILCTTGGFNQTTTS